MSHRLLVAVLLVASAALLYVPPEETPLAFDALSYASQSLSLTQGHGNTVPMGAEHLPGYYPVGVPFLASLAVRVAGPELGAGIYSVLVCALIALALTAVLGQRLAGSAAGLTALLLLLGFPIYQITSGYLMSQVPTAMAVVMVTLLYLRRDSASCLFGAGLLSMLSLLLRYANVSFPIALGLAELLTGGWRARGRLRSVMVLGAGMAAGAACVLLHNQWANGGPLKTGYMLWSWAVGSEFSLDHWSNFSEMRWGDEWPLLRSFVGLGRLYSVPAFLFALWGSVWLWRRRATSFEGGALVAVTATSLFTQYAMLSVYYYKADLYLMSNLPLLAAVAAVGIASLVGDRRAWLGPLVGIVLLAWSLTQREPLPTAYREAVDRHRNLVIAAQHLENDAVLVTTSESPMVEPVICEGTQRRALYLGPFVSPLPERIALAELGAPEETPEAVVAYVRRQMAAGRPVYFDRTPPPRFDEERHRALRKAITGAFVLGKNVGAGSLGAKAPPIFPLEPR